MYEKIYYLLPLSLEKYEAYIPELVIICLLYWFNYIILHIKCIGINNIYIQSIYTKCVSKTEIKEFFRTKMTCKIKLTNKNVHVNIPKNLWCKFILMRMSEPKTSYLKHQN